MNRRDYDTVSRVLLHAFFLLVGMQLFTLAMIVGCGDWAYGVHARLFSISREAFDLSAYGFLALMKIMGLGFFLVPWIAMRINARRVGD